MCAKLILEKITLNIPIRHEQRWDKSFHKHYALSLENRGYHWRICMARR